MYLVRIVCRDVVEGCELCHKSVGPGGHQLSLNPLNWRQMCVIGPDRLTLYLLEQCGDDQLMLTALSVFLKHTYSSHKLYLVGFLGRPLFLRPVQRSGHRSLRLNRHYQLHKFNPKQTKQNKSTPRLSTQLHLTSPQYCTRRRMTNTLTRETQWL